MAGYGPLLPDLLGLGLIQPKATLDQALFALDQVGAPAAARILARHKVRRIARARIADALPDCDRREAALLGDLDRELAAIGGRTDRAVAAGGELLRLLRAQAPELPVLLMKGMAIRDWYPPDLPRDVGDADLWVPDADSGWLLAGQLRELGYQYEPGEMPWLKRDQHGVLFGQIRLIHPEAERVDVDIHTGPYSVRYCGLLVFARSGGGSTWGALADEDIVCSVLGNAAGDCFADAKTVNDLVLAASRDMDLGYVAASFAATELGGFLNTMVEHVAALCQLRPEQAAALDRLRTDAPPEELPLADAGDADRRVRLVTEHATLMGRRLTGDQASADRIAAEAKRAYSGARPFRMRMSGGAAMRAPAMNPWTCVRLAPQPLVRRLAGRTELVPVGSAEVEPLSQHLELVRTDAGDLVRFGADVFLPTVDYLFCRRLVEAELVPAATAAR